MREPKNAALDDQGILYLTDGFAQFGSGSKLWLYQVPLYPDPSDIVYPVFLGDYTIPDTVMQDLALDSQGNLYASEREGDRIYKWSPATLAADGSFTPGQLIGWLGRCDSGPGCDQANDRSFGYSCSDATCSVSTTGGSGPGQFDFPRGIALDNNDILYVTDSINQRVQRFTPDGYFAGQAVSECDGSCFVLGDFGAPKQVSVNSSHFYVLDEYTDLLHVFETTPLTRIDGQTAQIVYQSANNFVGSDSFTFRATDGLASSAPATVQVDVTRNFRPPVAIGPLTAMVVEDGMLSLAVEGYDPNEALDTLEFEAVDKPLNGTFAPNGSQYVYTPEADFEGVETFSYAASDGVYLSQLQAGRGFKTVLTVNFYDPDVGDINFARVDWGDGVVQDEVPMNDGSLSGPILGEGDQGGYGTVTAEHVFAQNGAYTVQVCVRDNAVVDANGYKSLTAQSTTVCKEIAVQVSPMTDMLLDIEPSSNPMPLGSDMSYRLTLTNNPPQSGSGCGRQASCSATRWTAACSLKG